MNSSNVYMVNCSTFFVNSEFRLFIGQFLVTGFEKRWLGCEGNYRCFRQRTRRQRQSGQGGHYDEISPHAIPGMAEFAYRHCLVQIEKWLQMICVNFLPCGAQLKIYKCVFLITKKLKQLYNDMLFFIILSLQISLLYRFLNIYSIKVCVLNFK